MTPAPETVERVIEAIRAYDPIAGIRARSHSRLRADLQFNSVDRITLSLELEDHFEITIADAELWDWDTVADIALCVDRLSRAKAA